MNIDEFLDNVDVATDGSEDTIDLSNESSEDIKLAVLEKPVENSIDTKSSSNAELKNSAVDSSKAPGVKDSSDDSLSKKVIDINSSKEQNIEHREFSESISSEKKDSSSLEKQKIVSDKLNNDLSMSELIHLINSNLKEENLISAKKNYLELINFYKKLKTLDEKKNLDKTLLKINSDLKYLYAKLKYKFDVMKESIELKCNYIRDLLIKQDLVNSKKLLIDINELFQKLPAGFESEKELMLNKIITIKILFKETRVDLLKSYFEKQSLKLEYLFKEIDLALSKNNLELCKNLLKDAEICYKILPTGFEIKQTDLFDKLLKRKKSFDLILEFHNLKNEVGNDILLSQNKFINSPYSLNLNAPANSVFPKTTTGDTSNNTNKNTTNNNTADTNKNTTDTTTNTADTTTDTNKNTTNNTADTTTNHCEDSSLNNNESVFDSNKNCIDSNKNICVSSSKKKVNFDLMLKKLKLNKAKIDILQGNYSSANKKVAELIQLHPKDKEVLELSNNSFLVESKKIYDSEICSERVQEKLCKGINILEKDFKNNDLLKIKKDYDYLNSLKDMSPDLKKAVNEIDSDFDKLGLSNNFKTLKGKVNSEMFQKERLLQRKLALAKHQIKKGNFKKAKINLEYVLEFDSDNREVRKLLSSI